MHSYRLSGRDGCMLRNSNIVIGRTVNAKSNQFAFSPSPIAPVFTYLFLATSTAVLSREAFSSHPVSVHLLKTCHLVHRNRKVSSLLILLLGCGERVQISKILDRHSRCLWLHGALLIHDSCTLLQEHRSCRSDRIISSPARHSQIFVSLRLYNPPVGPGIVLYGCAVSLVIFPP